MHYSTSEKGLILSIHNNGPFINDSVYVDKKRTYLNELFGILVKSNKPVLIFNSRYIVKLFFSNEYR